jgi:transcriptional regulator with XRE-family HTH domain
MKASETKFMKHIGKKLRAIRLKRGFTLHRAAADFNIRIETLKKIEAGTTNYNLTLFVKICKHYKTDLTEIMP